MFNRVIIETVAVSSKIVEAAVLGSSSLFVTVGREL
jgi:hypothetical protein